MKKVPFYLTIFFSHFALVIRMLTLIAIYRLLLIGCTLPLTSAEPERSFSLMTRIKNYAKGRLSDLAVIALHYKETVTADYIYHLFC